MDKPGDTPIYLERINSSRNMARFYAMSIQPTLFGEVSLIRNWGRVGTSGRNKIETSPDMDGLTTTKTRVARRKRQRGYTES